MATNKKKQKGNKDKEQGSLKNKVVGTTQLVGAGLTGKAAIESGVPRILGVRLEQHGTSKAAAKQIIKEGFLDPSKGGSESGVTASMRLPKEFLERSKGYTFVSGKNSSHPLYKERNFLSPIGDVIRRQVQVAGYKGSKSGKINDWDMLLGQKFIGVPAKALVGTLAKDATPEQKAKIKADIDRVTATGYRDPKRVKEIRKLQQDYLKQYRALEPDMRERFDSKMSSPSFRRMNIVNRWMGEDKPSKPNYKWTRENWLVDQTQAKEIPVRSRSRARIEDSPTKESRIWKNKFNRDRDRRNKISSKAKKSLGIKLTGISKDEKKIVRDYLTNSRKNKNKVRWLKQSTARAEAYKKLLEAKQKLGKAREEQQIAKYLGLSAAWTAKLATSPVKGALGVGRTLYIPGIDEYFDKNFKYDPDDPFVSNPLKLKKTFSEGQGMGGNALKTDQKVRAFGNKWSATKWLLKKEGNGSILKGAKKLMSANKGRVGAGIAILGLGSWLAALGVRQGINTLRKPEPSKKDKVVVKASLRKGKVVKSYTRKNVKDRK